MPFTSQEITDAGKVGIDHYLKNRPVDQIAVERPFLKALNGRKRSWPGSKQYVVEQLRYRYQSNFQWFNGSQVVTYNRRQSIEQAQYPWRSAHDGFSLDEDRLIQNGIQVDDDGPGGNATQAEMVQLTDLFKEQSEILRLGFQEKFSHALQRDGAYSTDAIVGRDALIDPTPLVGTVGGIDASLAQNAYWRNYAKTGLTTTVTTGDILDYMEIAWRACVRNGGRPTHIEAGDDFIDGLRQFLTKTYGQVNWEGVAVFKDVKLGTEMMSFHGVPIVWNPEFDDLDGNPGGFSPTMSKRCYFMNLNHMSLRPIQGQDMLTRKPPRAYDKYEYYWGLTWRGAMTTNRRNAQAILSVA